MNTIPRIKLEHERQLLGQPLKFFGLFKGTQNLEKKFSPCPVFFVGNQKIVKVLESPWEIFCRALSVLFIPRREVRTQSPDGVQLKVFPIYIALVSENEGFKNTSVNRPFSNRRKTLSPEGKCLSTLPMGSIDFSLQLFLDR